MVVAIVMNSGAGESMSMRVVDEVEIVNGQVLQLGPCLDVTGKLDVVAFIFGGGHHDAVVDVLSLVSYGRSS